MTTPVVHIIILIYLIVCIYCQLPNFYPYERLSNINFNIVILGKTISNALVFF